MTESELRDYQNTFADNFRYRKSGNIPPSFDEAKAIIKHLDDEKLDPKYAFIQDDILFVKTGPQTPKERVDIIAAENGYEPVR